MPFANLVIRFIRSSNRQPDRDNGENDDILTIVKLRNGIQCKVIYNDQKSHYKSCSIVAYADLHTYLRLIFDCVTADDDPFRSIQVLHPLLPSYLIYAKRLQDEKIQNLLHACLQNFLTMSIYYNPQSEDDSSDSSSTASSSSTSSAEETDVENDGEATVEDAGVGADENADVDEEGFQRLPSQPEEEPSHPHHGEEQAASHPETHAAADPIPAPMNVHAPPFTPVLTYPVYWTFWVGNPNSTVGQPPTQ